MKKVSKTLNGWADAFVVASVLLIVISILGFFLNSAWTGSVFDAAIVLWILSPLFRGLSVLVQNAEEEIADRRMVKPKSDD